MAWCPASGISITGVTRPSLSYMDAPMSGVTSPYSERSRAKRHVTSSRYGAAMERMPAPNCSKIRRSNFHCQPPVDLLEGVAGHEVDDVVEVVLLGGHRPEVSDGVVEIGVRPRSAEGLAEVVRADLRVELGHRRVAHDDAVDLIPVARRGGNGDESAHAVADDDGQSIDPGRLGHRHHLVGPLVQGVGVAVATVPVARQIDRHHPEFGGEGGRHVRPPVGVGAPTVHEDQSPPARFAPGQ